MIRLRSISSVTGSKNFFGENGSHDVCSSAIRSLICPSAKRWLPTMSIEWIQGRPSAGSPAHEAHSPPAAAIAIARRARQAGAIPRGKVHRPCPGPVLEVAWGIVDTFPPKRPRAGADPLIGQRVGSYIVEQQLGEG